jgi:hypothetical protein
LTINVADLVFFQNGMLEPWLQSKGLTKLLVFRVVSVVGWVRIVLGLIIDIKW